MILSNQHKTKKTRILTGMFLLCFLPSSSSNPVNFSTPHQVPGVHIPIWAKEASYVMDLITTSKVMKHWKPEWYRATMNDTIYTCIIRINCIVDEDSTVDFGLLNDAAATMHRINQNIPGYSPHLNMYLALVPGLQNDSDYASNLHRISTIATAYSGVISYLLIDLSSIDIGPLDGFSLTDKWTACNEVGIIHGFRCGFIFDSRICSKTSVFGHVHSAQQTPVFLSMTHGEYLNIIAGTDPTLSIYYSKCINAIKLSSLSFKGFLQDTSKVLQNITKIRRENNTEIGDVFLEHMSQENMSNIDCHLEHPKAYSNISGNHSTSVVISISSEDLCLLLLQDVQNRTHQNTTFLDIFHRFLVVFQTIQNTSDSSRVTDGVVSIPTLLESVLEYSVKYKSIYHLRPIELWISFTPEGNLHEELEIVAKYEKEINSKLPGTVLFIVLDYNNLRIDESVISVIKRDVETCNSHEKGSYVRCGYIFHARNCRRTNEWLNQLAFEKGSLILFRGEGTRTDNCMSAVDGARMGGLGDKSASNSLRIDFTSKTVKIPPIILNWGEGLPFLYVPTAISSYRSYDMSKWQNVDLEAPPFLFPKHAVSFLVKLEDVRMNKHLFELVTKQRSVVISIDVNSKRELHEQKDFQLLCPYNRKIYDISILIGYHPDLAANLTMLNTILSGITTFCGDLINEVLIDWNPCFSQVACLPIYFDTYGPDHFDGLTNITKYVAGIKQFGVKIGLLISAQTVGILMDAYSSVGNITKFLLGRQKTRALEVSSLFSIPKLISMLNQFDSFLFEMEYPLPEIFALGVYPAVIKVIGQFEIFAKVMNRIEPQIFPHSNRQELRRFKLRLSDCDTITTWSWNQTLAYSRFWEILGNWAGRMNLAMDAAYESGNKDKCKYYKHNGQPLNCGCGWWFSDFSSGEVVDVQSYARSLKAKELKEKANTNVKITAERIMLFVVTSIFLLSLTSLSVLLVIKFYRKRYILSERQVRDLLSEFPSNVDPVLDMTYRILIGQGSSNTSVYRCYLKSESGKLEVAVKAFKAEAGIKLQSGDLMAIRGLVSEAQTLRSLQQHTNIVHYFGICTAKLRQGQLQVVLEYCTLGSLNKFLHGLRNSNDACADQSSRRIHGEEEIDVLLSKWSREISTGLEYLAFEKIVHADIATRNILLDQDMCCKICDFGLSRRMEKYSSYWKNGEEPLPWRWMAPESLRKLIFNEKTDVWMFGVTLWEIYTFGEVPYGGLAWSADFPRLVEGGLRLELPNRMPRKVRKIVETCWDVHVNNRPTFSSCKLSLMSE